MFKFTTRSHQSQKFQNPSHFSSLFLITNKTINTVIPPYCSCFAPLPCANNSLQLIVTTVAFVPILISPVVSAALYFLTSTICLSTILPSLLLLSKTSYIILSCCFSSLHCFTVSCDICDSE